MYEKEINLINVSFIFHRKLASRECVLRGPKMLKIDFTGGWQAVPCPWLYGPGFLDCWTVGPRVRNSKMITGKHGHSENTLLLHNVVLSVDLYIYDCNND